MLVETKLLSSRNKIMIVATNTKAYFCSDKTFVATKIILAVAPANDTLVLVATTKQRYN